MERQVIGWFTVEHPESDCCTPSGKFPVFLLQDEEDFWYGFPQYGHNGLKIGKFDRKDNVVAHPDQLDRRFLLSDEQVRSDFVMTQICHSLLLVVHFVDGSVILAHMHRF